MRVDLFLVSKKMVSSREEAQELIRKGLVLLHGVPIKKPSKNISEDEKHLSLLATRRFVSRGGEKLEGVFLHYFNNVKNIKSFLLGKEVLDVGSSTGGFTDFLLQNGAKRVVAIDVGTNQLHTSLRGNPSICLHENTDIRSFHEGLFPLIVADLSFVSLETVFDSILDRGEKDAIFFLLVKPQFEVGKGNTKKGVVKDEKKVNEVLAFYGSLAEKKGALKVEVIPSVIKGGDGNQEYFLIFTL